MKANVKVGGRMTKNDPRSLHNWVGSIEMKATNEGDQFLLAAIYRGMFGDATELRDAIAAEAEKCREDHRQREKRVGQCATIVAGSRKGK